MVTVPLKSPDCEPLGVMQILNKENGNFDENDINLIEIMGSEIAAAIKAAQLYEQARLATIVRFIGDISHDVKNMITPAMTGAETLKMIIDDCYERFDSSLETDSSDSMSVKDSMGELRDIYPDMIEMIIDGCNAVQDRMAEISSAVKGVVSKPNYEPADIQAIAQRVDHILTPHAQKKGVSLNIDPLDAEIIADVDSKQLYNAIYNLLFNAIDACKNGDSVTLKLTSNYEGSFPEGNFILMECIDTGPGIPEKVRALLFTDQAISTKPMGTGLGTRIVKNVIDAHKGLINVISKEGNGTNIQCRIPANRLKVS
jgi:signal transduction histidine kinase